MKLNKVLSFILVFSVLLSTVLVAPVVVRAEDNTDLPFVVEDTDYGVEDNRVKASKIVLTDDSASFVTPYDDSYKEGFYHGNGCVFVKKSNDGYDTYYLIGKHGFVRSFDTEKSESVNVYSILDVGMGNCYDELYVVENPETHKKDIYNATINEYFPFGADSYYPFAKDYSVYNTSVENREYQYKKGIIRFEKNGKYGLLNRKGELLYEANYNNITPYANCFEGENETGYYLLSNDGKVNRKTYISEKTRDDVVCVLQDYNDREAIINTTTLKPISGFGFENSFDIERVYEYSGEYYTLASKKGEDSTTYYIVSNDGVVNVNQLLNDNEIFYQDYERLYQDYERLHSPYAIGFIVDRYYKDNVYLIDGEYYPEQYEAYSWVTPDGKNILYSKYDVESYLDCYLYNDLFVVYDFNSITIEDVNGNNVVGKEYTNVSLVDNVLVCSQGSEETNDLRVDYYSCLDKKIIASDESFDLSNSVPYQYEHDYLEIVSKDDKGNFGIVDFKTAKFSGFVFNYKDCFGTELSEVDREADRTYLSFSRKMEIGNDSNQYVFELWDDDSKYDSSDTRVLINSDFKILDKYSDNSWGCLAINKGKSPMIMLDNRETIKMLDFDGNIISTISDPYFYHDYGLFDDDSNVIPKAIVAYDYENLDFNDEPTYKLVSDHGEVIIDGCDLISHFANNVAYIEKDEYSGLIDFDGNFLVYQEYDHHYYHRYCGAHGLTVNKSFSLAYEDDVYIYDFSQIGEIDYSDVHKFFSSGDIEFKNEDGFYYKDSYFNGDTTKYNHSLATMSLCMAFSTYGVGDYSEYDKNVKMLMKRCGFAQNNRYMQFHFNERPTTDSIGCAIGSKEIDGTTLVAVAVRSGGYESEWASNFNMGRSGDHTGFDESANTVKKNIISYIKSRKLKGDIKIWITGFSRGAAVATQTAAKLNKLGDFTYNADGEYYEVGIDKSRIYAYGFATPAGADKDSNPHSARYNNIFNVIEFNDIVPLVAPSYLDFDRYGTTKLLPYRESFGSHAYSAYFDRIKEKMGGEYKVDGFTHLLTTDTDTIGTFNRKLVNDVAKGIGSRDSFINNYQRVISDILIRKYSTDSGSQWYDIGIALMKAIPNYLYWHRNQATQAYINKNLLAETHANQKYYLYWMQMMDENYKNHLPLKWGDKNYRAVKINCPVDVKVFDKSDTLVAEIKDDKPVELENGGVVSGVDENEQKIVYLPVDGEYNIQIEAREKCTVSYSIEEYNAEFGDMSRAVSFKSVPMEKAETLNANVDAFSDEEVKDGAENGSDANYNLAKQSDSIDLEYDAKGADAVANHNYNITVNYNSEEGTVYGGGQFMEGDYVKLQAEPNEKYLFDGFYINGERIDDEDDNNEAIRFRVDSNVDVVAKFTPKPQPKPAAKKANTIKVTVKTKTVKIKTLKKKAQVIKPITVKKAKGKVSYKLTSVPKLIKKYVKISSKGAITIKKWKKAKKGTYKIKVKITANGNTKYKKKIINKTVIVKIK